jgi:N utilization substance protein B
MQALYSQKANPEMDKKGLQKALTKSIDDHYLLFNYFLQLMARVCTYVVTDADVQASRILNKKGVDTRLADNVFVKHILDNPKLYIDLVPDAEIKFVTIKPLYKALSESEGYSDYLAAEPTIAADAAILSVLLREFMANDEELNKFLEEETPIWHDDKDIILGEILDVLKRAEEKNDPKQLSTISKKTIKDEKSFADDLLTKTLTHRVENRAMVEEKLKNWDIERISSLDILLMELAITEFLFFEEVPLKVSLNEYIEISKWYSSPKSKEFINGILDNLMQDLKDTGSIVKKGRGLAE